MIDIAKELFDCWYSTLEQDEKDIVMDYADGCSETEIYEKYGKRLRVKELIGTYQYYMAGKSLIIRLFSFSWIFQILL